MKLIKSEIRLFDAKTRESTNVINLNLNTENIRQFYNREYRNIYVRRSTNPVLLCLQDVSVN